MDAFRTRNPSNPSRTSRTVRILVQSNTKQQKPDGQQSVPETGGSFIGLFYVFVYVCCVLVQRCPRACCWKLLATTPVAIALLETPAAPTPVTLKDSTTGLGSTCVYYRDGECIVVSTHHRHWHGPCAIALCQSFHMVCMLAGLQNGLS